MLELNASGALSWVLTAIYGSPPKATGAMHGMQAMSGPFLGNLLVAVVAGVITIFCFAAAIKMIVRPGERDTTHPKYRILRADR